MGAGKWSHSAKIAEVHQAGGILLRMALSGGVCSETCPQCAEVNTFPGFALMEARCSSFHHCGQGVVIQRPLQ